MTMKTSQNTGNGLMCSFKCTLCPTIFLSKEALLSHFKLRHSLTMNRLGLVPTWATSFGLWSYFEFETLSEIKIVLKSKVKLEITNGIQNPVDSYNPKITRSKTKTITSEKSTLIINPEPNKDSTPFPPKILSPSKSLNSTNISKSSLINVLKKYPLTEEEALAMAKRRRKSNRKTVPCKLCSLKCQSNAQLKIHSRIHKNERPFKCPSCPQSFNHNQTVTTHVATVHSTDPDSKLRCPLCPKRFATFNGRKRHVVCIHLKEFSHKCPEPNCTKTFPRSDQLKSHSRVHSGEKPYKCSMCLKAFPHNSGLILHVQKIHTGERPYICEICGEDYPTKYTLVSHQRVHNNNNEKPFKCNICDKKFRIRDYLRLHLRIHNNHTPYQCYFCGQKFTRKASLTLHISGHTMERPHICRVCNNRFRLLYCLKVHIRLHTGEKPYRCQKCSRSFIQLHHLKQHLRHCQAGAD